MRSLSLIRSQGPITTTLTISIPLFLVFGITQRITQSILCSDALLTTVLLTRLLALRVRLCIDASYPVFISLLAWSSPFPQSSPNPSALPVEWVSALNAAVAAGKIPNIPQSSNTPGVNPVYPPSVNPSGPEVCSATYKCRNPADIWDAPTGVFASSFDDGPLPVRD
jgi:hypothetical protein